MSDGETQAFEAWWAMPSRPSHSEWRAVALAAWLARAQQAQATEAKLREAAQKAREAFRLTREYVGEDVLPAIEGWSWYDADQELRAALEPLPQRASEEVER